MEIETTLLLIEYGLNRTVLFVIGWKIRNFNMTWVWKSWFVLFHALIL